MLSRSDYINKKPVFLLEVVWGSIIYRFATEPVYLEDDGQILPFIMYLDNPQYIEKTELLGVDIEDKSIPFALFFDGVNISFEEFRGNTIEGATGELSFLLQGEQFYKDRTVLAQGIVSQPIYGHPDRPPEYVEFSLESRSVVAGLPLLASINQRYVLDEDVDEDATFDDRSEGKKLPVIIGSSMWYNNKELYNVPAYYGGSENKPPVGVFFYFYIASHHIMSKTAKIQDDDNNIVTANIIAGVTRLDNEKYQYSKVSVPPGSTIIDPRTDVSTEYWVCLHNTLPTSDYGGILNPYGDGILEGAGDVCMWALTTSGIQIDFNAWYNVRGILNEYKIAGVLQDDEVTGLEWLQREILPFLPVEVVLGRDGISPRLNMLIVDNIDPTDTITAGDMFYRAGAITPITEPQDLCNTVQVRFGWIGRGQRYKSTIHVGADRPNKMKSINNEIMSQYSKVSISKYGKREKIINLNFVMDYYTASRIATDYIRLYSMPRLSITYNAHGVYGWLRVGDVILLTDLDIYIEEQKAQILSKKWTGTNWEFVLEIEVNYINNDKAF